MSSSSTTQLYALRGHGHARKGYAVGFRQTGLAATGLALLLFVLSSTRDSVRAPLGLEAKLQTVAAVANQRRAVAASSKPTYNANLLQAYSVQVPAGLTAGATFLADVPARGQMLVTVPQGVAGGQMVALEMADNDLAVAKTIKAEVGDKSSEGENLGDADYGAPDDMQNIAAVQAAVQAGADSEIDDAIAKSKTDAIASYVAAKSDFMGKETMVPNGGVGSIIAMEGEPGHPANYARNLQHKLASKQHRAYGTPSTMVTKLVQAPTPKVGVLTSERYHFAHPEAGASAVESKLIKQAEHMMRASTHDSKAAAKESNSVASYLSTHRKGLIAKLHTMALSYQLDEHKAEEDLHKDHHQATEDADEATEDAQYEKDIHNLLSKILQDPVPKTLPSYDAIHHQNPTNKNGADVTWGYTIPDRKWTDRVPSEGEMDEWKKDAQKGLNTWQQAGKDLNNNKIADMSDDEWKRMSTTDKRGLGDALENGAADRWSQRMRKALDGAQKELNKDNTRDNTNKTPRIAPDSLTDELRTECGVLRGEKIGGVRVFKGIPYAMAPTGALRWAPPVSRHAGLSDGVALGGCWAGTFMATSFGKVCPQEWDPVLSKGEKQGEDCLSLNVYAPTVESEEAVAGVRDKLPVVVFIHGGGNFVGAGSRYDMWQVADRGFVAVTINYRLGSLGFLALSSLSNQSPSGTSGNYGLRDIALSLEWVQKNIATFGGDAGRVTLMGHGSGATNVLGLSISPLATLPAPQTGTGTKLTGSGRVKLFHGIVLLSASPRIDTALRDIEPDNEVFAITAGCTQDKLEMQVECLRKLDVDTILRVTPAYKWDPQVNPRCNQNDLPVKGGRNPGLVIVDGDVILQPSWTALGKSDMLADVPVMAMVMAEESDALPANKVHSWEQLRRLVSQRLDSFGTFWKGGAADTPATSFTSEALTLYPESMYPQPQQAYETMITDVRLICPTKKALGLMASATTNKVYMAVNHLRLVEPVAVVALSSDGIRSTSVGGLAGVCVFGCGCGCGCGCVVGCMGGWCVCVYLCLTLFSPHTHIHAYTHISLALCRSRACARTLSLSGPLCCSLSLDLSVLLSPPLMYTHARARAHTHTHIHSHSRTHKYVHTHTHTRIYIHTHVYIYVYMYVCIYIYVYTYMYIYAYIYIRIYIYI